MRWISVALLLVLCAGAAASEVWRWVDDQGVVHYSDRPQPGAERVEMKSVQSYQAPQLAPQPGSRAEESEGRTEAQAAYSRLSIVSPADGETLWNIGGELNVQLTMNPPLASGHELEIYLDGQRVDGVPQATQFTLGEVYRGEHRLRASIVDASGRELVSSATIVFYVQQASVQNPAQQGQPTRPRPRPRPRPAGGG
jgi:hypothetical protein